VVADSSGKGGRSTGAGGHAKAPIAIWSFRAMGIGPTVEPLIWTEGLPLHAVMWIVPVLGTPSADLLG